MSTNPQAQAMMMRQNAPTTGSLTQVQTSSDTTTQTGNTTSGPILRLRGAHAPSTRRVQWAENVVNNEGLGRKSSKVCCIYHAPRMAGESSGESSSDSSSSDSDSDSDNNPTYDPRERAREQRKARDQQHGHEREPNHPDNGGQGKRGGKRKSTRRPSPNAYERQPRPKQPTDGGGSGGSGSGGGAGPSGAGAGAGAGPSAGA
ncbi:phosphatase inhibitor-domain-containing protein [Xylaria sp. CBS 124048]|nr:phosphatase inhibitor-domain-containing protein [Xylaria sp. CBS 124048]